MQKYLIVVDMQNDFIDGVLGSPAAQMIVPRVALRIESAIKEDRTVLFTQDTHTAQYLDTSEGRHLNVPHCLENSEGWKLHRVIAPYAKETFLKPGFGSLAMVEALEKAAEADGANLDVELCGLCTDICIVLNALLIRAHLPEATIRVAQDACAGITPEGHAAALHILRACHIALVNS